MQIQNINTNLDQPNFNSRYRVDQKKNLIYIPPRTFVNTRVVDTDAIFGKDLLVSGLKSTDRTYDSFTGMRDKNYLIAALNKKMQESKIFNKSLSVAMFDMDNFKSVNELLGYETGDKFIKAISRSVSEEAKKEALYPYRFGGDEFVIVFNNESQERQKQIADRITEKINDNEYIKSEEPEYHCNAVALLQEYNSSNKKIQDLLFLKSQRDILSDVHCNLTTKEAKNDPYLMKKIDDVNDGIRYLYKDLITECIENEEDENIKDDLSSFLNLLENNNSIPLNKEKKTDEYLLAVYDKSAQIYQTKKWLSDFHRNKGFSMSGGIVTFSPEALKDKTPMDIIDTVGEVLKKSKNCRKGTNLYVQTA